MCTHTLESTLILESIWKKTNKRRVYEIWIMMICKARTCPSYPHLVNKPSFFLFSLFLTGLQGTGAENTFTPITQTLLSQLSNRWFMKPTLTHFQNIQTAQSPLQLSQRACENKLPAQDFVSPSPCLWTCDYSSPLRNATLHRLLVLICMQRGFSVKQAAGYFICPSHVLHTVLFWLAFVQSPQSASQEENRAEKKSQGGLHFWQIAPVIYKHGIEWHGFFSWFTWNFHVLDFDRCITVHVV